MRLTLTRSSVKTVPGHWQFGEMRERESKRYFSLFLKSKLYLKDLLTCNMITQVKPLK